MLSTRRATYDFDDAGATRRDEYDEHEEEDERRHRTSTAGGIGRGGRRGRRRGEKNFVSRLPGILPSGAVNDVMEIVGYVKSRDWLSDNPDSVDGLPSLHLNLIARGRPVFERDDDPDDDPENHPGDDLGDHTDIVAEGVGMLSFPRCITRMTDILRPHLYDTLLPAVREISNSRTVVISDVFLRNYGTKEEGVGRRTLLRDDNDDDVSDAEVVDVGDDVNGDDNVDVVKGAASAPAARFVLSPHYDVTAYATCVIALDSTASTGRNGLYVVPRRRSTSLPPGGVGGGDGVDENGIGSSGNPPAASSASVGHAALRRFFALEGGDGVAHSYDVLHGVDVDPDLGNERTSLIVWFTDNDDGGGRDDDDDDDDGGDNGGRGGASTGTPSSWLVDPDNDVGEFVLGLAIENSSSRGGERDAKTTTTTPAAGDHHAEVTADPYSLYLSSARTGNVYAISAIAQMCSDGLVPESQYDAISDILTSVHVGGEGGSSNPFFFGRQQRSNDYGIGDDHRSSSCGGLAIAYFTRLHPTTCFPRGKGARTVQRVISEGATGGGEGNLTLRRRTTNEDAHTDQAYF